MDRKARSHPARPRSAGFFHPKRPFLHQAGEFSRTPSGRGHSYGQTDYNPLLQSLARIPLPVAVGITSGSIYGGISFAAGMLLAQKQLCPEQNINWKSPLWIARWVVTPFGTPVE